MKLKYICKENVSIFPNDEYISFTMFATSSSSISNRYTSLALNFCGNVYEEIAFGPRQMGFSEDIVDKRTQDCLNLLEINHLKDRAPYHLSGGEKRKVAIASVLSLNPYILMLDEPLNGLDSDSQEWLVNFLINLKSSNKTILLSTHDETFAHTVCDREILINKNHQIVY